MTINRIRQTPAHHYSTENGNAKRSSRFTFLSVVSRHRFGPFFYWQLINYCGGQSLSLFLYIAVYPRDLRACVRVYSCSCGLVFQFYTCRGFHSNESSSIYPRTFYVVPANSKIVLFSLRTHSPSFPSSSLFTHTSWGDPTVATCVLWKLWLCVSIVAWVCHSFFIVVYFRSNRSDQQFLIEPKIDWIPFGGLRPNSPIYELASREWFVIGWIRKRKIVHRRV